MNLLVENESTHPISRRGEKSFALLSISPFLSCQRHESSGRKRVHTKKISTSERLHISSAMRRFAKTNGFARISFRPLGLNLLVENASPPPKYQPRRGCTSATLHRRDRWQGCAMPDFCVWVRISTNSRKAAPCGVLPKPMVSPIFLSGL